jgi:osmotically-inducible protein OsmY
MNRSTSLKAMTLALALLAVSGCAAYREYRDCGWAGCADDAKITQAVKSLLAQNWQVRDRVYVQTWGAVVYLTGRVTTDAQRDAAESIAHEPPGVRQVVSNLTVIADSGA